MAESEFTKAITDDSDVLTGSIRAARNLLPSLRTPCALFDTACSQ